MDRPPAAPSESPLAPTPFGHLVRAHAAGVAGDAFVTVSLAGSLFFTVPTADARPKVLLYLLLTMLPFAVVAPLLGPVIDRSRGGRRTIMAISLGVRAIVCVLMLRDLDSLFLYPEAFAILVSSKLHAVVKSALVPALVADRDRLVQANARLGVVSAIVGAAAGIPAAAMFKAFGTGVPLLLVAIGVFGFGAYLAMQIPRAEHAGHGPTEREKEELRAPSVVLGGWAQGALRFGVGFLTFLVAFTLEREPIAFGVMLALAGIGSFLGTAIATPLRRRAGEEMMLAVVIIVTAVVALVSARVSGTIGLGLAVFSVGIGASVGKQAFDSIVQRDAPDAIRGRTFARFEMLFQVMWVIGGVIPVLFGFVNERVGLFVLAVTLAVAAAFYGYGVHEARTRPTEPPPDDPT